MKLDSHFLLTKPFREHHFYGEGGEYIDESELAVIPNPILFKEGKPEQFCVQINVNRKLQTQYYVGVDWLTKEKAIYVEPKLNGSEVQTNYFEMLFAALSLPEAAQYATDLYEIKLERPSISIKQSQDLLTPLLVVAYLNMLKEIVRKGLKKSYYKVEHNLYGRVKGKVMVGKTIKENALKNKTLHTWCSYDEFGINGLENRLLKKALVFIKRYLPSIKHLHAETYTEQVFNYISPAFEEVSEKVSLHDIMHTKPNAFYKDYTEALRLAKMILQRFGYNISNTSTQKTTTPPFWIDMSKLFEFYVLGKLKAAGYPILYQKRMGYDIPDYLLKDERLILDAKYKTYYSEDGMNESVATDIRQLAGYGRNEKVRSYFGITSETQPKLMIIYPNQTMPDEITKGVLFTQGRPIPNYYNMRKVSVKLPMIKSAPNIKPLLRDEEIHG